MPNITQTLQQGKGSAIHRLLNAAAKAEKKGLHDRAATLRQNAAFLKSQTATIWG
jgi:hypothetical protein